MRKIQVLRHGLGVVHIIERAAAVLRGAIALKLREAALVPELHGKADDGAALLLQESGDGGRVDTSGHGDGDQPALSFDALGQGVELDGCAHADSIISSISPFTCTVALGRSMLRPYKVWNNARRLRHERAVASL